MAIGSTIITFEVQLADTDRGVYEDYSLRVAQHPSETDAYMLTRVLAHALEHAEGIDFGGGISQAEEPAVLVRDLTGSVTAWIEVGAPDAERLHRGSRLAERTVVYTHRDPAKVIAAWAGKRIHRSDEITVFSFDPGFIEQATPQLERRNTCSITVTERMLYLDLNGTMLASAVHEHSLS
ncbi:YaeQ family protein [Microbacterium esteraromaticum]|uniref:YaeQ family protein n=1 Tax=Microbacterium esteraromaticum TaxID=57043 RepID=UPI001A8C34F0|nr:YaeQ family protein [Microbacterium esteraromaticum]MBN8424522.1 YaeQ family protein [Microbacterium esteraromaticum]